MNKVSIGVLFLIGFVGLFVVGAVALDPACQASSPKSGCNGKEVYTFKDKKCTVVNSCDGETTMNAFDTGMDCAKKCMMGSKGTLGSAKKAGKKVKKGKSKIEKVLNKPLN